MFHLQNHILNMDMTKYQENYQESRKRSRFDPRSPHDSDVLFYHKDWEELTKATNGMASVLQFIPNTFISTSSTFCHNTHDFLASCSLEFCVRFKFTCK